MAALINPLIKVFQTSDYIMNMVLGDVSNNDALKRVRGTEGSSVTWIVGHLCFYRINIMKMFGSDKQNDFEEFYYKNGHQIWKKCVANRRRQEIERLEQQIREHREKDEP